MTVSNVYNFCGLKLDTKWSSYDFEISPVTKIWHTAHLMKINFEVWKYN